VITFVSVGTCSLTATQGGNANFTAATPISQSFTLTQVSQSVTFTQPTGMSVGGATQSVTPTASSGLTVSLASNSTSICTVSGFVITPVAAGTCSLTATQGGNANFTAATPISQSFTIVTPAISPSATSWTSTENSPFTAITMTPTGFTGTLTYVSTPPLPTGLTINSTTGEITGTPRTAKSTTPYTITATSGLQTATAIVTITVTAGTCVAGAGNVNTCFVGNIGPGGGIVFYVNETNDTGSRYLEAAAADLVISPWDDIVWCSNTTSLITGVETITVASASVIGSGKTNTDLMVAGGACTSGAANSARAYGTATAPAGSWFLPSMAELNQLYGQRAVVGGFAAGTYWSSSQNNASNAWFQYFINDFESRVAPKVYPNRVRPVRAF
jgi:hypothetical protein